MSKAGTKAKSPKGRIAARVRQEYRYLKGLMRHPRTPKVARWLIGAGIGYLVSPIDLIPDFIPIIGQLDDVLVLGVCIGIAMLIIPRDVKAATRKRTCSIIRKRSRDSEPNLPARYLFETAPLPGEFGVRVMYVHENRVLGANAIMQLESLIFEHHLIVADDKLITALNAKPLQLSSLCLHHNQLPYFGAEFNLVDLTTAYHGLSCEDRQAIEEFTVTDRTSDTIGHIAPAPLVCRHPRTKDKFLHPNLPRLRIRELNDSASNAWIEKLIVHTEQPGYHFKSVNCSDQVIAWDTIAVQTLFGDQPLQGLGQEPTQGSQPLLAGR